MSIRLRNYVKSQVTFLDLKVLNNQLHTVQNSKQITLKWKKNHSTLKCFITCLSNYQSTFGESCLMSAFVKIFFGKLRIIEIGPRGRWKRSSIFQSSHPSQKSMLPKANKQKKKKTISQIFHKNTSQKPTSIRVKIKQSRLHFREIRTEPTYYLSTFQIPKSMLYKDWLA